MPVSDAGRRRRLRRPVPIISELSGLPAIGPKTLVVLAPDGVRVYVGEGRWLAVFEIDHRLGQARLANSLDLAGVLASLDVAPDGTAYAWVVNYAAGGASSTVVGVVRQGRVVELADLPTRVGSTAATRSSLAAVVPASALEPPRLVLPRPAQRQASDE